MPFIFTPVSSNRLIVKSRFDLRDTWSRLTHSNSSMSDVTLTELTTAFKSIQDNFVESGDLSVMYRQLGGTSTLRHLVGEVDRPLSLRMMDDEEIDEAILAAVRRGALVWWPGDRVLVERVHEIRARHAIAAWCARPALPISAGQPRAAAATVTPSQLRRQVGANGSQETADTDNADKAGRWRTRKNRIANARKATQEMPPGPMRDQLRNAADRFERNNKAVEQARLAEHVYHPDRDPPEGWVNVSSDENALTQFRLKPRQLTIGSTKVLAQVYQPKPEVFGNDMPSQVVFQGSRKVPSDWNNNIAQLDNRYSKYYESAVKIGKSLEKASIPVEFAGHSLGGGLGAAASQSSGRPASTFNAAGLHPDTVRRYSGAAPLESHINAFNVRGDIVTNVQDFGDAQLHIPTAIGSRYTLPGHGGMLERHKIETVIDGFEAQKREDQALIVETLNVASCR